jgi:regulatory protein YycH of two-component signal transduction system YycFG
MSGGKCSAVDIEYFKSIPISVFTTLRDVHNEAQELRKRAMQAN